MDPKQQAWNDAMLEWLAGGEHPLAHHPLAVPCDGKEGCFTVAPIRDASIPKKRYCGWHLPTKPKSTDTQADPTLQMLKEYGLPVTRENYLYVAFMGNPPEEPLDGEIEASLPPELRRSDEDQ